MVLVCSTVFKHCTSKLNSSMRRPKLFSPQLFVLLFGETGGIQASSYINSFLGFCLLILETRATLLCSWECSELLIPLPPPLGSCITILCAWTFHRLVNQPTHWATSPGLIFPFKGKLLFPLQTVMGNSLGSITDNKETQRTLSLYMNCLSQTWNILSLSWTVTYFIFIFHSFKTIIHTTFSVIYLVKNILVIIFLGTMLPF